MTVDGFGSVYASLNKKEGKTQMDQIKLFYGTIADAASRAALEKDVNEFLMGPDNSVLNVVRVQTAIVVGGPFGAVVLTVHYRNNN